MTPADLIPILDQEPWALMAAIADACEEQGETHLAAGWRWLAARRRHPLMGGSDSFLWVWVCGDKGQPMTHSWALPAEAWDAMPAEVPYASHRATLSYHSTCSSALAAAAQAMATLHERGEDLEALR